MYTVCAEFFQGEPSLVEHDVENFQASVKVCLSLVVAANEICDQEV
jgi:hypothetical protein